MRETISPFPYYGGKARMAEFIAERLDYDNTNTYVEPFGGAARVLLNKPRHDIEIYNDYSTCLTTFFEVMADEEKTEELIALLLDEYNPPTEEIFEKAYFKRIWLDDDVNTDLIYETKKIIKKYEEQIKNRKDLFYTKAKAELEDEEKEIRLELKDFRKAIKEKRYQEITLCLLLLLESGIVTDINDKKRILYICETFNSFWEVVQNNYNEAVEEYDLENDTEEFKNYIKKFEGNQKKYKAEIEKREHEIGLKVIEAMSDSLKEQFLVEACNEIGEVGIAAYVFILHYCSRDGMGTYWSNAKNESRKRYENAVINLRRVSERMQGVQVNYSEAYLYIWSMLDQEYAMMYLDPSYLSPRDIKDSEESEAKEKEPKDLGGVYKRHFGIEEHRQLLNMITGKCEIDGVKKEVKAKIMISNYDVDIYNEMLAGWNKYEFETVTTVGTKASKRTECIWTNY